MCVVSMVGDHYNDKWKELSWIQPLDNRPFAPSPLEPNWPIPTPSPSKQEFDKLKEEVEEMKKLLTRAKLYDEKNNEPNCEIDDKVALLKRVAEMVGISLDDVFKPGK